MVKGWHRDSYRHYLAAKGIKTKRYMASQRGFEALSRARQNAEERLSEGSSVAEEILNLSSSVNSLVASGDLDESEIQDAVDELSEYDEELSERVAKVDFVKDQLEDEKEQIKERMSSVENKIEELRRRTRTGLQTGRKTFADIQRKMNEGNLTAEDIRAAKEMSKSEIGRNEGLRKLNDERDKLVEKVDDIDSKLLSLEVEK